MIEDENLKYFITEDIFILNEPAPEYENSKTPLIEKEEMVMETKPEITVHVEMESKIESPVIPPISAEPEEIHDLIVLVLPMNSKDKELLINLLKAIQKIEADVKLINSFSDFKGNFKKLLSFGYLNELKHQLDASMEPYQCINNKEQEVLIASPLSALHDNKAEKTALWNCLQKMFL
jgi:hypothetical protein